MFPFWPSGDKTKKLTGHYPHGKKFFHCTFTKEQLDSEECVSSENVTSGDVYWRLIVKKQQKKDSKNYELGINLKCEFEDHVKLKTEKTWKVEADHTIRLLSSVNTEKIVVMHGTTTFESKKNWLWESVKYDVLDGFFQDDSITFEVEVGLKSVDLIPIAKTFSVETPGETDVVLVVDEVKFFANKKTLTDASSTFKTLLDGVGDSDDSKQSEATVPIDNTNSNAFRMLLDIIYGNPVGIEGEHVEELMKLGERFKIDKVAGEVAKFLKTSVVDDAEAVRLADQYKMEDVITHKLESLNTLFELKTTFKSYRYFNDNTMRLLLDKLVTVSN